MTLGTRLYELRQAAGVSLQKAADEIGVSKAHIWELEKGRSRNPSFELVTKLSVYYGVSPDVLTGAAATPAAGDLQIERIHRDLVDLSQRDRDLIETMVKSMRQKSGGVEAGS